jgi:cell division protease FtsH
MDDKIGQRTYARPRQAFLPGLPTDRIEAAETTTREIDVAVRDIIAGAFERATEILQSRRSDLEEGVKLLLTRETLTVEEFPVIRSKVAPAQQHTTIQPQDEGTPLTPAEC